MTPDTAAVRYGEHVMTATSARPVGVAARRDDTRRGAARRPPTTCWPTEGPGRADGPADRRRRRHEHDERLLPLRRQGRRARRAVRRRLPAAGRDDGRRRPRATTRSRTSASAGRATGGSPARTPTYYSLMFDRVVPDFEPSPAAMETALGGARPGGGAGAAGDGRRAARPGDAFSVAAGLWACEHGMASLEARTQPGDDVFDWDTIAPLTVDALIRGLADAVIPVRVRAPLASVVVLVRFDASGVELDSEPLRRDGDDWVGEVADGTCYGLVAEGDGPRFDASKLLLDPRATEVWFPPGHDRQRAAPARGRHDRHVAARRGPGAPSGAAVATFEPAARRLRGPRAGDDEAARRDRSPARTPGCRTSCPGWPRSASPSSSCCRCIRTIPQEGSYWGYMPLAFGAVHRQFAAGDDAAGELAAFVTAAHDRDIEVWLDVVFNHTTEVDETGPTYSLRGLSDGSYYRLRDGRLVRRDDRVRQRPRCLVAVGPGPRGVVARPVRRSRHRRVPLRPGGRPGPRRRLRGSPGAVGRAPWRAARRRAVGRRRHAPPRAGLAGAGVAAVERPVP